MKRLKLIVAVVVLLCVSVFVRGAVSYSQDEKHVSGISALWEGRVVQGDKNNRVYFVHKGVRHWVTSWNYVKPFGLSQSNMVKVEQVEVDSLPEGSNIRSIDDLKVVMNAPIIREGIVIQIIDGNTLVIFIDDKNEIVRLKNMDAPKIDEPGGVDAKKVLANRFRPANNVTIMEYARDKNAYIIGTIVKREQEKRLTEDFLINHEFEMVFTPPNGKKIMRFAPQGVILKGNNHNENRWRLQQGKLEFLDHKGRTYSRFSFDSDTLRLNNTRDFDTVAKKHDQWLTPVLNISDTLEILKATYGTDERQVDVTEKVRKLTQKQKAIILVGKEVLGVDPHFGVLKRLQVTYKYKGKILNKECLEREKMELP